MEFGIQVGYPKPTMNPCVIIIISDSDCCRPCGPAALSTSVKDSLVSNSSTELDYFTDDPEDEMASEEDTSLKPDIRRKMDSRLPPSSHESSSLLYDPLARSEFILLLVSIGVNNMC